MLRRHAEGLVLVLQQAPSEPGRSGVARECRPDIPPLDIAKHHVRTRRVLLYEGGITFGGITRPVRTAIKPIHELAIIVPHAKGKHHPAAEGLAHGSQAAELLGAAVDGRAPRRVDGVPARRGDGARDDHATLLVDAADLAKGPGRRPVVRDELRDHRERLGRVHRAAGRPVIMIALVVRVEAAAALVTVGRVIGAGVRRERGGDAVGLEDVHLVAAEARLVRVEGAVFPRLDGALGIAVPCAVVGGALVQVGAAARDIHLGEVERAILAAGQRRKVHVESELLAQQLERDVVAVVVVEEVDSW